MQKNTQVMCDLPRDISKVATPLLGLRIFFEVFPDSKLYASQPLLQKFMGQSTSNTLP